MMQSPSAPSAPLQEQPGSPESLLATLGQLIHRQFTTEQELITFVLKAIAKQLHVLTPFLSSTLGGRFEVLDVVEAQGCIPIAGTVLPLSQSY